MNILIASRSKACKLSDSNPQAKIISMTDIDSEWPDFGKRASLKLRFNDEENDWIATAPNANDVRDILRFARTFKPDDTIIVHCEAGICRSSAVALGVYVFHHGLDGAREAFKAYDGLIVPNSLLARLLDEAMSLNGGFIALCEGFAKGWDAVKGVY